MSFSLSLLPVPPFSFRHFCVPSLFWGGILTNPARGSTPSGSMWSQPSNSFFCILICKSHCVIALLHKSSDGQTIKFCKYQRCCCAWLLSSCLLTTLLYLNALWSAWSCDILVQYFQKEVAIWFWAGHGSTGITYHPILSHFQTGKYVHKIQHLHNLHLCHANTVFLPWMWTVNFVTITDDI